MDENMQKEQFSQAYVHAVASVAGFKISPGALPDDDSVDITISASGGKGTIRSPKMDVQLKCWGGFIDKNTESFSFSLRKKNYDDLRRTDYMIPRILVVVVVPKQFELCLHQNQDRLELRKCGYWVSLWGFPERNNTKNISVKIPIKNIFSVEELKSIMNRVGIGEMP